MNILWLFRYTPHRYYNHWFHSDFAKVLANSPDINLKIYGFDMHKQQDIQDLLLKQWDEKIVMNDLYKEFKYDVVILDCWNRAYKSTKINEMWLPKDFKYINVPKIVIEGDYHNISDPKWYSNLNIDAIFHRHLTNVERANEDLSTKNIWLPCSIDTDIFKPNDKIGRMNKFCAVGEMSNGVYKYRIGAFNILNNNNLIERKRLVKEEKYINCLQSYISHLSGASIYDLDIAKNFEIMASGSVLFTDATTNTGIQELFPNDSYCTYERDYSNLLERAKKIYYDKDYRDFITSNAIKCINENHTHDIRKQQLIDIIRKEFSL